MARIVISMSLNSALTALVVFSLVLPGASASDLTYKENIKVVHILRPMWPYDSLLSDGSLTFAKISGVSADGTTHDFYRDYITGVQLPKLGDRCEITYILSRVRGKIGDSNEFVVLKDAREIKSLKCVAPGKARENR